MSVHRASSSAKCASSIVTVSPSAGLPLNAPPNGSRSVPTWLVTTSSLLSAWSSSWSTVGTARGPAPRRVVHVRDDLAQRPARMPQALKQRCRVVGRRLPPHARCIVAAAGRNRRRDRGRRSACRRAARTGRARTRVSSRDVARMDHEQHLDVVVDLARRPSSTLLAPRRSRFSSLATAPTARCGCCFSHRVAAAGRSRGSPAHHARSPASWSCVDPRDRPRDVVLEQPLAVGREHRDARASGRAKVTASPR